MRHLLLLIVFPLLTSAQIKDSLIASLMQAPQDTERVNQLYQAGFNMRNSDPPQAFRIAVACQEEAKKSGSKKHLAKSYNLLGVLYYKRSDYTRALMFHRQALQLRQEVKDVLGIAISQTNLGNIYTDLSYFRLAESSYLDALQQYRALDNKPQAAKCLINLGVARHEQKHSQAAIQNLKEALAIGSALGDYEIMAICNNDIGEIMAEQNMLDTALVYIEEGLKMRQMLDNEVESADSYLNIAQIYIKQNRLDEAEDYLDLVEKISSQYDYVQARITMYKLRADILKARHNYEQALEFSQKYHQLKDSLQNIEKENLIFLDETATVKAHALESHEWSNVWLLVGCLVCVALIPLLLFRFKR